MMRSRPVALISIAAAFLAGLTLLALPGKAVAATPCWKQVVNDWLDNEHIDRTYPIHCYKDALKNLPEDLRDYSNIADDISAAILAQERKEGLRRVQGLPPHGSNSGGGGNSGTGSPGSSSGGPDRSLYRRAIDDLGTQSADSIPIPLLVLASLGGLLILTAAGLAAAKRIRAMRAGRTPPAAGT